MKRIWIFCEKEPEITADLSVRNFRLKVQNEIILRFESICLRTGAYSELPPNLTQKHRFGGSSVKDSMRARLQSSGAAFSQ